ncbi:MAG: sortase [Weeksellaceae bacterium]
MQKIARILIVIGFLFSFYGMLLVWQRNNPQRLTFSHYQAVSTRESAVVPIRIRVVDLDIDLPVVAVTMKDNKWQTTDDGVSYLKSSPIPGEKGNAILYGHNWPSLLGKLNQAQTGNKIEITLSNKTKQLFVVHSLAVVSPDQSHVLQSTPDARITLYTCTGFLDSKRLVITAMPAEEYNQTVISQR